MFQVLLYTILPIFSLVVLGCILKWRRFLDSGYAATSNRIVFNVAIPAMVLNEITRASFGANFDLSAILCLLAAIGVTALLSLPAARLLKVSQKRMGTFLQSGFHGNIGYLSYAIAYYALGESYFARLAIMSSFVMVTQNFLAVWMLATFTNSSKIREEKGVYWKLVFRNPVVVSATFGIILSIVGVSLPGPVERALHILSGMAFPTALLLIGAGLSFGAIRGMLKEILGIGILKFAGLPLLGYGLMKIFQVPQPLVLPGIILLAAPPATITYVMAVELGGDPELAATSISILTLVSALTYSLILAGFSP